MTNYMDRLKAQLELHEGRHSKVYRCPAGKLTVGIGRNLEDVGLSEDEIEYLFKNDLTRVYSDLVSALGQPTFDTLDDIRRRVLTDMMFNLGLTRFRGFKNMIAAVKARNWHKAADEMVDSKWYRQVGDRGPRLVEMMRTGEDYDG